jgi:hypothetical protein
VSDGLGATGLALKVGEYCYYGVSNNLALATSTVALTFGGPGLLVYALANGTAAADPTTTPALFTFPAAQGAADYSARPVLASGTPFTLGKSETAVLFLINNSPTDTTATLLLNATDPNVAPGS